jgi:hypothetical protein
MTFSGEKDPKYAPPLEQEALFSVDWGGRVGRYLCFCEELVGCFAKATFIAVIVDINVEHLVALPRRVRGRLRVGGGEGH